MRLTKQNIISDLNNLFFPIEFRKEYAEQFIDRIKFIISNDLNNKLRNASKEEFIQITIDFIKEVKLTDNRLDSFIEISNNYLNSFKEEILNSFNPNFLKQTSKSKITLQEAILNYLYFYFESLTPEEKKDKHIKSILFYSLDDDKNLLKEKKNLKKLKSLRKIEETKAFDKDKILKDLEIKLKYCDFWVMLILRIFDFSNENLALHEAGIYFDFNKTFEENYIYFDKQKIEKPELNNLNIQVFYDKKEELREPFQKVKIVWNNLKLFILNH